MIILASFFGSVSSFPWETVTQEENQLYIYITAMCKITRENQHYIFDKLYQCYENSVLNAIAIMKA